MAEIRRTNAPRNTRRKKRRRGTLRLSVILLIFIACIVVSFIYYYSHFDISSKPNPDFVSYKGISGSENNDLLSEIGEPTREEEAQDPASTAVTENEEKPADAVAQSERKDDSYLENCAFIGDSITSGFSSYKFVPVKNVFAQVGLRTDTVLTSEFDNTDSGSVTLLDGLKALSPESVYIMLGSNGIAWQDNEKMITEYGGLIDSVRETLPDAQIYIMSVTPVGSIKENKATPEEGKILNTQIDSYNLRLADLASKKNAAYLDINTMLKGSDGKLPEDISRDGMHLNKATYEKVIEYILTHTV